MPIYEYDCNDCNSQVEIYFRSFADLEVRVAVCPNCQRTNLKRRISQVIVVNAAQGDVAGQPNAAASAQIGGSQDNPQTLAQTMRQAEQSAGQKMDRAFNEVVSRLERGETATSIEKSLRKSPAP